MSVKRMERVQTSWKQKKKAITPNIQKKMMKNNQSQNVSKEKETMVKYCCCIQGWFLLKSQKSKKKYTFRFYESKKNYLIDEYQMLTTIWLHWFEKEIMKISSFLFEITFLYFFIFRFWIWSSSEKTRHIRWFWQKVFCLVAKFLTRRETRFTILKITSHTFCSTSLFIQ